MINEVTKDELERFFAQAPLVAEKLYGQDQAELIANAANDNDAVCEIVQGLAEDDRFDDLTKCASMFVYAFQLGREYELFRVKESLRGGK
jgi:hypothetical protein